MGKTTARPQRWKKRPLTVEAVRYDGSPDCLAVIEGWTNRRVRWDENHGMPVVLTPQGTRWVNAGDWVIVGVAGEVYPVQSDIFEMSYDPDGADYRAFLTPQRVREIQAEGDLTSDPAALRGLLAQVADSYEARWA